ncbi:MAG TPA: hypothetical protein VI076_09280 [Actinopolymorphaceae bacterium]
MVNPRSHSGLAPVMRAEVRDLRRRTTSRRPFRPRFRTWAVDAERTPVGAPGEDLLAHFPASALPMSASVSDHGLRVDLLIGWWTTVSTWTAERVTRSAPGAPSVMGMLDRPGALELSTTDLAWWRSWRTACAIAEQPVGPMVVLTRHGWIDVETEQVVAVSRYHRRAAA